MDRAAGDHQEIYRMEWLLQGRGRFFEELGDEVAEIVATTEVHVLKPELHTEPHCYYAGVSKEVR